MVQFFIALFLSFFFFGLTWVFTQNVIAAIVVAAVSWFFSFLGLCFASASHHYEEKSFSSDHIQLTRRIHDLCVFRMSEKPVRLL